MAGSHPKNPALQLVALWGMEGFCGGMIEVHVVGLG